MAEAMCPAAPQRTRTAGSDGRNLKTSRIRAHHRRIAAEEEAAEEAAGVESRRQLHRVQQAGGAGLDRRQELDYKRREGGGMPPAYASTAPIGRARPDYYSPYPYSTSPSPPPSPELSEMASLEGLSATSPPDRASISPGLARRPREAAYPYANNKTAVGVEAPGTRTS